MTAATFRLGTATTNSAGTVWSWRGYDSAATVASGSYVKCELQSSSGVKTARYTISTADDHTMSAGTPTVTLSGKAATFQAASTAATYIVQARVNGGIDANAVSQSTYTSKLAVHVLTADGYKLIAVGETDENHRTYGHTEKVNSVVKILGVGSNISGDATGTFSSATVVAMQGEDISTDISGATTGSVLVKATSAWTISNNVAKLTKETGTSGHWELYGAASIATHTNPTVTLATIPINTGTYAMIGCYVTGIRTTLIKTDCFRSYTSVINTAGSVSVTSSMSTLAHAGDDKMTIYTTASANNALIMASAVVATGEATDRTIKIRGRFCVDSVVQT